MEPRRSLGWPILLGVVLIGSILALGVGWVLVSIAAALGSENAAFYWAILGVGVALLVLVLVGVIVYLALTVKAIALSQRQSNFIDSVTHELKSPLASLKLSLQTLARLQLPGSRQLLSRLLRCLNIRLSLTDVTAVTILLATINLADLRHAATASDLNIRPTAIMHTATMRILPTAVRSVPPAVAPHLNIAGRHARGGHHPSILLAAIRTALQEPDIQARLRQAALEPSAETPAQISAVMRNDYQFWEGLSKRFKITTD
jgi:signal transduction histidine kinase